MKKQHCVGALLSVERNCITHVYGMKTCDYSAMKLLVFLLVWVVVLSTCFYVGLRTVQQYPKRHVEIHTGTEHPYLSAAEEAVLEEKLRYAQTHKKVILAWNGDTYKAHYIRPTSPILERECGSCLITTHDSYVTASETAAVVVNYMSIATGTIPPRKARRSDQLYVFQVGEPPPLLKSLGGFKTYKSIDDMHFNATMMVWRESNIYGPFGSARKVYENGRSLLSERFNNKLENLLKVKSKMAIAVISNCKVTAGARVRVAFVKALKRQGLAVDTFGKCFKKELPRSMDKLRSSEYLIPYKFYLSFENTYLCKDYITEKFFSNGLSNFAIPVVWGPSRRDYAAVAPPNSFIHVDDFRSTEDLIKYLQFLDQNDQEYMQYLKWVDHPTIEKLPQYQRQYGYCQLCRMLHGINIEDVYSSNFNENHLERPLLTDDVSRRTVPAFQDLMDSLESKECFWKLEDFLKTNKTLAARSGKKYLR